MKISNYFMYKELGKSYLKDAKTSLKNLIYKPSRILTLGVMLGLYECDSTKFSDNNVKPAVYECNNSQDDDGDGLVDMLDPGCSSLTDNDEYNVPLNQPPIITSTPSLEILVHKGYVYDSVNRIWKYDFNNYQYDADAADPENDLITYYLTQAPNGMAIDSVNGLIEFPLSFNELGKHSVTVAADDGNSSTEQNFILDVKYPYVDENGTTIAEYAYVKGNDEMVLIREEPFDEEYFNNKWTGINIGFNALTALTGVTPHYTSKPIELHLEEDTRCLYFGVPGYFSTIRRNEGYAPLQGKICTFVGDIGIDPASLQDQRLIVHELVHVLQYNRISANLPNEFTEPQAYVIADVVVGDVPGYDAIGSYCEERPSYPYQVFYDLCTNCGFDYDKEQLFWDIVSTSSYRERLLELTQVFSDITSCSAADIENIFLENKLYQCSDGIDDNNNGLTDLDDPNCVDSTDTSEILPDKQY